MEKLSPDDNPQHSPDLEPPITAEVYSQRYRPTNAKKLLTYYNAYAIIGLI
jgi:hypothetical protein